MTNRRYKTGIDREQGSLLPPRVEDYVSEDAVVRAVDVYVETLDLVALGFLYADGGHVDGKGQPPYHPADHLKLYLYGYLNKIRSSRCLERETQRNLEVIWLLGGLKPSYKTIADFRKDNADGLKATCKDFILLCRGLGLFGGDKIGIDGSFFNGDASKASIYTKKKLDKQLMGLEKAIERYQKQLDEQDSTDQKSGEAATGEYADLSEKLVLLKKKQTEKQTLKKELEASGETQISTTDKDARLLNKGNGTISGYNVQIAVDDKHRLIAASDVTNDGNDKHQLHRMAKMAAKALNADGLEVLADCGYHNEGDLALCEQDSMTTFVPEPKKSVLIEKAGRFTRDAFCYDASSDSYRCPQGEILHAKGKPHKKNGHMRQCYTSKTSFCKLCPLRKKCLSKKGERRNIYRSEYEDVVKRQQDRMTENPGKMRERSGLVEHPFGTVKHRAGWTHFLVRGFEKVGGEWAIMATCYNFTRVLNIIGMDAFRKYCLKTSKNRKKPVFKGPIWVFMAYSGFIYRSKYIFGRTAHLRL